MAAPAGLARRLAVSFPGARDLAIALIAGAALGAAFPKVGWHPLVWIALVPLLWVCSSGAPMRACWLGIAFGMANRSLAMYWVVYAMTRFGGLPLVVAILAAGALVLYLALYWGLFGLVVRRVGLKTDTAPLVLAATWTGLEFLRGWLFTGFPWSGIGYAAGQNAVIAQLADIAGVHGLGFLAVLTNAALAAAVIRTDRARLRPLAAAAAALAVALLYGQVRLADAPEPGAAASADAIEVAMVQGSIEQDQKWSEAAREQILSRQIALSADGASAGADLVVWAESAWPDPWGIERNPAAAAPLLALARSHEAAMLVGTVHVYDESGTLQVSNAGVLYDREGEWRGRYEKSHLVPFGEYLPFRSLLGFLGPLVQAVGELRPGAADQELLGAPDQGIPPLGLSICYEVIFSGIAREQVRNGAQLLVTITNDAWYGTTSGPYQHWAMARLRAIENRRYLVRAANNGISGVFDPWGRIVVATELNERRAVLAQVQPHTGLTLYARTGDLFAILCAVMALWQVGVAVWTRERAA